jgi:signal peptidase I
MKLRWFLSTRVRRATDVCRHVRRLLNAQRDLLAPQAVAAVSTALQQTETSLENGASDETVGKQLADMEKLADKWIKPYPHAEWRENIEVFLVAIVVAMAVRTFFLQPFKIPTGSMQPTLYGVTIQDLHDSQDIKMPGLLERIWDAAVYGEIYHEIIAPEDCRFLGLGPLKHPVPFLNKQDLYVQYADGRQQGFPVWCGPDEASLWADTGVMLRGAFHKGEPIVRFKETTGDHLFVDRFTYNFRRPERGEIVVFKTRGIPEIPDQNQFYIKRLVGLPGDTISIGDDQHARINGQRLDASTPHFENVYGFQPGAPRLKDHYSGHVLLDDPRSLLREPTDTLHVDPGHYAVFGDNTMNSFDSRFWRELPQPNVIGKSFFVYWPISQRFGWGHTLK